MSILKSSFKLLNYKLLLVIFLSLFIPIIYRTVRFYIIGTIPDSNAFNIASNLNWVNVVFEVLEECFLLPLFFALNKFQSESNSNRKIIGKFYWIILIYILTIIICIAITPQIMKALSVKNINSEGISFVRVELFSRLFEMLAKIISVLLIAKAAWRRLLEFLFINTIVNITLDALIVADNNASAKAGVIWIAWDQIFSSLIMLVFGGYLVKRLYNVKLLDLVQPIMLGGKEIWKQNLWSGMESFIRNSFFLWFVIKTIGKMPGEYNQGDYWMTNSFIWDWLLLPIMTLSQYINRDQAFTSQKNNLKERLAAPMFIICLSIIIWLVTIPSYGVFIKNVLNSKDYKMVSHLAMVSIGFYVTFAFNEIIDKIFYGSGKASYMFWQSILTNVIVYIPYFYASPTMSLENVAIMFGIAVTVDGIFTFVMFAWWISLKQKFEISRYYDQYKVLKNKVLKLNLWKQ